MNLRKAIDVMSTNRPTSSERAPLPPYDMLYRCLLSDTDDHIMSFRFEYNTSQANRLNKKKANKKRNAPSVTSFGNSKATPVTNRNPINELLSVCQQNKYVDTIIQKRIRVVEKQKEENTSHKVVSTTNRSSRNITRATWNLHAIAPLIVWLQKKNIRYVHSDWVNEFSNGERICITSQRGIVLSNQHITKQKHYVCNGAFHQIQLQSTCKTVSTIDTNTDWWKNANCAPHHFQSGILHSLYQRRTYLWNNCTYIHLNTTNGNTFNVVVEHYRPRHSIEESKECDSSLCQLLGSLAYHLSQHTNHQKQNKY